MSKEKTVSVKMSEKDYENLRRCADKENISMSSYIRSLIKGNVTQDWIKKTTVQQCLSDIEITLDKYEEKNKCLTDTVRKKLNHLWKKL